MKKWVSHTISGILGALILFLIGCQITMIVTAKDNYNVPSLFGYSFLRVETNSMEGDNSDSLKQGTGIIIKKYATSDVKMGDVITFQDEKVSAGYTPTHTRVTHRVEKVETATDGTYVYYCTGDNVASSMNAHNIVEDKYYIGTVVGHSDSFGAFLNVALQPWFVPVVVLVPLAAIAVMSGVDLVKEGRKEQKEEDAQVAAELAAAGVDPNDEKAVLLYTEKARYKIELKKEMAQAVEEEKKRLRKEMAKGGGK
jgi:signal peptidase